MFSSIRWRLVGTYFLVALVAIGVLGLALLSLLSNYFLQQERAYLLQNAEALAERIAPRWTGQDLSYLAPLVSAYSLLSQARICVLDRSERLLLDSWAGLGEGSSSFPVIESRRSTGGMAVGIGRFARPVAAEEDTTFVIDLDSLWGGHVLTHQPTPLVSSLSAQPDAAAADLGLVVQAPIRSSKGILGYVQISREAARGAQILRTTRSALLWAASVAVLFAIGMGLFMSQSLTAPLKALANAAQAMAQGDLRVRAPAQRQDEIGQVASQFNRMAENLEQTFAALAADRDALRRFAADASHELRTPITALKTFNELLQGPAQDDPEARREFLAESQAQINRLDWLTDNLLQLSRLDSGLLEMERTPHSLAELVNDVVALFLPQAREKGVALLPHLPEEDMQAEYDPQWLAQALGNLLSNAIKFTDIGGRVTVGVSRLDDTAEVWVEDTGIGISQEDLPHIFGRFYRGKGQAQPGSGLGLAIAQAVLQAHGSRIVVESKEGAGSRFSFRLPLAAGGLSS